MPLKYSLIFVLIMVGLKAKSQILLNDNSSHIKKVIEFQGSFLKKSLIEKNKERKGYYHKMIFASNIIPPEGNDWQIEAVFYLTLKNQCFKYYKKFWGDNLAHKDINELKKNYPDLKEVKKNLKWIDNDKNFEMTLIPKKIGNNKFASIYLLEIKKINTKID